LCRGAVCGPLCFGGQRGEGEFAETLTRIPPPGQQEQAEDRPRPRPSEKGFFLPFSFPSV